MRNTVLILMLALSALPPVAALAAEPGSDAQLTSATESTVDAPAVTGSWFDGTISSIQFYDRVTGEFADPNGEGFYFIFEPDGTYREGAVISNTQYNCSMRLLGENQGTWTADGANVVLGQTGGSVSIVNTCGDSGVYAQGAKQTVYGWSIGPDDYGTETLSLTMTDGSPYGRFHRWAD